jgi:mycofactocin precursor
MDEDTRVEGEVEAGGSRESGADGESAAVLIEDLLVEDVSIDGMCGVY